jgi:hypothetical protein
MKNSTKIFGLIVSLILYLPSTFGQTNNNELALTGSLYADSKIISETYPQTQQPVLLNNEIIGKKTPMLSGLFSAIIPGAGQFYNEDYWIAGIFVAVEAAVITTAVINDNKGDDQTEKFENFADDSWSVVKYAEYLDPEGDDIEIDYETPGLEPWERIVNWSELNAAETGSHHLPPHGDQQYYELIGKYHQYIPGWPGGEGTSNPPQIMLDYSGMRGDANDFYTSAKTAVIGIYVNHLLSAVEAVWGAVRFNNDIAVKMRVENINLTGRDELIPTLNVRYSF